MNNTEFEKLASDFDKLTVKHPKQNAALERAVFLLTLCSNVDFLLLAGPTGAGKSHLLERLFRALQTYYAPQVEAEPSMVPCLATLAVADGAKRFGWKRLWADGAQGLNDPFREARSWRTSGDPKTRLAGEAFTTSVAREDFEHELRLRRTRIWVIDEAQHILLGGSAGAVGDQFDVLKSVSQVTPVKLVLCGTYQLPQLLSYSGQVMRRSATVTLAPYSIDVASEVMEFAGVCSALLKHLPGESIDPQKYVEELFYGTIGCIGVLKDWIARAWAYSYFKEKRAISMDDFMATRLPATTLISMHDEIVAGSEMNSTEAENRFRKQVLAHSATTSRACVGSSVVAVGNRERPASGKGIHHKRKPGVRKPGRDPVKTPAERSGPKGGN